MKCKKHAKVLSMLYLSAMLLMLLSLSTAVSAAEAYQPLQAEIPYKHIYTTTDTKADSVFQYIITAKNGAPLPAEASENGSFSFKGVSGSGVKNGDYTIFELSGALNFTFTRPGVYVYEINADMETEGKKINLNRYTFEPDTITVTFYISNADADGMKMQLFTIENQEGVKLSEIKLDSAYTDPIKPMSDRSEKPDESQNPASYGHTDSYDNTETVLTGDNSYILQFAALTSICGICIILLIILRKKGRAEYV